MLQITDAAVTEFRRVLELPDAEGSAIRIQLGQPPGGEVGIMFQPVDGPMEGDSAGDATGLDVFVSSELTGPLSGSVLDADEQAESSTLYLRPLREDSSTS